MAVGPGPRDGFRADNAVRAGTVVDDKRLSGLRRERLSHQSCDGIGTARAERHDDADRAARVGVAGCARRPKRRTRQAENENAA